jgi:CysZ protein
MIQSRLGSLLFGLTLPIRATRLILRDRALLTLSALPVAISLGLYVLVIVRVQGAARERVSLFFAEHGLASSGWLVWSVQLLLGLMLFLVGALTFSIVTSVLASPFNDFLAERAERHCEPRLPATPSLRFAGKARLIVIDLLKTVAALAAALVALLVSWVPVINVAAVVLTCLLVTFQYVSYPPTRRGQGIGYGAAFLGRHLYACVGFGAATMVLFSIPFVSVLALPVAVVGGTLLAGRAQAHAGPYRLK